MGRDFSARVGKGPPGGGGDIRVFPSRVCVSHVNKQHSGWKREGGPDKVTSNLDVG